MPGLLEALPSGGGARSAGKPRLMRLEVGRFPAGGKQQEQGAIGAIAGSRPGSFRPDRNHFPVLIAHLPAEVPAALEDNKFQHLSAKHCGGPVIPGTDGFFELHALERLPHVHPKVNPRRLAQPQPANKNPAIFGIGGGVWERWCEAEGCPGVAPRTRLEISPTAPVRARRFCKQSWPPCMHGAQARAQPFRRHPTAWLLGDE